MKVTVSTETDVGLVKIRTGGIGVFGGGGTGSANIIVSDIVPANVSANSLWYSSNEGVLKIYYSDGTSNQWVDAFTTTVGPQGPAGDNGKFTIANSVPASPKVGEVWFNSNTAKSYIYYSDGVSNSWVLFSDPVNKGDPGANIVSFTWSNVNSAISIVDSLNNTYTAKVFYPEFFIYPLSDETTPLTARTDVATLRPPFDFILTQVPKVTLTNVATSGTVTVDVNKNGTSILGANKITIDPGDWSSYNAAVQSTVVDATVVEDDRFTIDIDDGATDATGLKITFYFRRA
jgi:hypothetical protein